MKWIAGLVGQDSAVLRETFAPHLKYHLAQSAARLAREKAAPGAPPDVADPYVDGRDAFIAQNEHARQAIFKRSTFELVRIADAGEDVVILARIRADLQNGETYDNLYSYHLRFEHGQIAEVWELFDTAYAFGLYPRERAVDV